MLLIQRRSARSTFEKVGQLRVHLGISWLIPRDVQPELVYTPNMLQTSVLFCQGVATIYRMGWKNPDV